MTGVSYHFLLHLSNRSQYLSCTWSQSGMYGLTLETPELKKETKE